MDYINIILIIIGLCVFETVSSIDNAIINAEVLTVMKPKARRWFLVWGLLFAVFIVRGLLPWAIVFAVNPTLGWWGSFTATFSNDPRVLHSMEVGAPILLAGGGVFLVFLFLYWIFLEEKNYCIKGERFFRAQGVWFFAIASIFLAVIVWYALKINTMMAFGAVIGSTAFFITHGFKQNAEKDEKELMNEKSSKSDFAKVLYLEIIDATFSIDGVLGAFAFTLSVPLILIGNGLGALVVRQLTMGNIERVKKYIFLKNGAMYSILVLGVIMIMDAFGIEVPNYISPISTMLIVLFFFLRSKMELGK